MQITGRCYCGAASLNANAPHFVTYCHCADCRRWTGAPVGAFAAFSPDTIEFEPALGQPFSVAPGVERWACERCGSPLAARFDYLPGQLYVPLGLLDQAADLSPALHCHTAARLPWLKIEDGLPRQEGSGRVALSAARD